MRLLSGLILLLSFTSVIAQDDDIPDYRKKWESFTKVPDKDIKRDLAAFTNGGIDESAGKLPLRALDPLGYDGKTMKFRGDNMQVFIETGTFDGSKHKLQYIENTHLQRIDSKPFYGDYGKLPKTTITAVIVVFDNKDTLRLPQTAFFDIYNPDFVFKEGGVEKTFNAVYLSADKTTFYIYLQNRKASDRYEVTWVIRDKKYLRRVVDYNIL